METIKAIFAHKESGVSDWVMVIHRDDIQKMYNMANDYEVPFALHWENFGDLYFKPNDSDQYWEEYIIISYWGDNPVEIYDKFPSHTITISDTDVTSINTLREKFYSKEYDSVTIEDFIKYANIPEDVLRKVKKE